MKKGNFKVRCIEKNCSDWFTRGEIYEVKDFRIKLDNGTSTRPIGDLDDLNFRMEAQFELVQDIPQYIIINQQSNTVTATLKQGKEVVKTAKAKCSPDDTFNFEFGAKLAFNRLLDVDIVGADLAIDTVKEVKSDKLQIGDRVRALRDFSGNGRVIGEIGTVKGFHNNGQSATIEFDNDINGHKGATYIKCGKDRHCWHMKIKDLEKVSAEVKEIKRPAKVGEWVKIVNAMPVSDHGQTYENGDCFKVTSTYACGEFDINVEEVPAFIDSSEYVVLENYQPSTTQINYSEIDYTQLDSKKMLAEIERRMK